MSRLLYEKSVSYKGHFLCKNLEQKCSDYFDIEMHQDFTEVEPWSERLEPDGERMRIKLMLANASFLDSSNLEANMVVLA
jgi:hypothetical protein